MTTLNSISINFRLHLNLHSLNNEGGEGNQTFTRQVTIIDQEGKKATVTAISGDMMKHIFCEHFWKIATDEKLPLSETSKTFNANRILPSDLKKKGNDQVIADEMLKTCSLSDVAGAMLTGKVNFARKSIVEFSWLVGIPQQNHAESFLHVKLVPDSGSKKTKADEENADQENADDSSNKGQNIYHRPANSGIYAGVIHLEIFRLGYNDVNKEIAIKKDDQQKRYKAMLKAILYTFIKPSGAMRNTQNPHEMGLEGVITYSHNSCPAPTISPLNKDYRSEIEEIVSHLNKIEPKSKIESISFDSLSGFSQAMEKIINM